VRCQCRIIGIDLFKGEVAGLIVSGTALGINDSEVGINTDGLGHVGEHLFKIRKSGTGGKGHFHHLTLAVSKFRGITCVVVIGGGVHYCEAGRVESAPYLAFPRFLRIDDADIIVLAISEVNKCIIEGSGIAVLVEQRASVRCVLS